MCSLLCFLLLSSVIFSYTSASCILLVPVLLLLLQLLLLSILLCKIKTKVPLNSQKTFRQRSISSEREETDNTMEGLEEPLKAKKRRESNQGRINKHVTK